MTCHYCTAGNAGVSRPLSRFPNKEMAAPRRPLLAALRHRHIFIGEACVATHCHLPSGIFTQVSVQRSWLSNALPDESVPLPLNPPDAIAVSPNTVTSTLSYSALVNLVAFASASICALFMTLPSLSVLMSLSASSG